MNIRLLGSVVALLFVARAGYAASSPELRLRFEQQAVRVEGMSRAPVSVLAVSRWQVDYRDVLWSDLQQVQDTGDGFARMSLPNGVPPFTIAVAVDEKDGRVAAIGAEIGLAAITSTIEPFDRDNLGQIIRGRFRVPIVHVLLVRPGKGTWFGTIGDGSVDDDDRLPNHVLTVGFARLKAKDGLKGPDHLLPHDVLVVIDPEGMRVTILQVNQ